MNVASTFSTVIALHAVLSRLPNVEVCGSPPRYCGRAIAIARDDFAFRVRTFGSAATSMMKVAPGVMATPARRWTSAAIQSRICTVRSRSLERDLFAEVLASIGTAMDAMRGAASVTPDFDLSCTAVHIYPGASSEQNGRMAMKGYGQFCPVAKGVQKFAERWSPVLRELLCGARISATCRGIPLMSRSLLSSRIEAARADRCRRGARATRPWVLSSPRRGREFA